MYDQCKIVESTKGIKGWLAESEAKLLSELASKSKTVVEVGAAYGKSTITMGLSLPIGSKLYSIDPHSKPNLDIPSEYDEWAKGTYPASTWEEFLQNIKKFNLQDVIVPIRKTSEEAIEDLSNVMADLLFIDGLHARKYVQLDYDLYSPLVVSNGWVAFHDANKNSVDFNNSAGIVAYTELIKSGKYMDIITCKSIVAGKKI